VEDHDGISLAVIVQNIKLIKIISNHLDSLFLNPTFIFILPIGLGRYCMIAKVQKFYHITTHQGSYVDQQIVEKIFFKIWGTTITVRHHAKDFFSSLQEVLSRHSF